MTPDEKIRYIAAQIEACEAGKSDVIRCPYCLIDNYKGAAKLCCNLLGSVVMGIMANHEIDGRLELADRIAQKT